ncbi:uncharacterized protein LOC121398308 isoform X2 [Xenopus laevis]|uniref:Uncharacterized protein LOC121398308 isoform X2 n=1 Tax=Xenopus laevis TaxID=8355 RepID=A0A8J1LVF1_XENLA|nr:uncharacterized protein LOC121398308 isoform X2 [Xenopus laevis]
MNRIEGRRNQDVTGHAGGQPVLEVQMKPLGFLLVLAGVLVLSWYLFLLPDKPVFFSMGLIITTIAVGSLLIIFASKSHSMLVKLICVVVTYLEMNIILWMEVASYYATILLTFLSSGIAVLIIAKRFNSSARVSHEVNYPDTLLAGVLVLSWYLFLLPDKSVFFSMGLIITTIAVGSLLIIFASNSHSMRGVLIWAALVTYLEMNIILWMEVASYHATILLTFLSSGIAVLIIAKRFNSSARVSHEVNYPDTLLVLAGVLVLSWYLFLLPDKSVFFSHSMLVMLIWLVVTYLEMNIILWMEVASYYATLLVLAGVLVLSWYLFLLPDKPVFFSMGLIITTIAVGSLLIIFASKSHSMLVKLICVVVTYLEMNIILWMEVASYYATILLTFLSSGIAVLIIAKRFNSSARVSHEVNYPDTLLAGVLVLSWYLFLLPDKSVFFSMGLIITTIAVGSLLIIFASNSHSMRGVLIWAALVTYLEMNIILWMEVASYHATILLTFLSSGIAVLIIAKRFNSSARVSHEVNYPDTLLAGVLVLSWYLFLLPDKSVFFSHSMLVMLICVVVTYLEMNIILWMEVASYYATLLAGVLVLSWYLFLLPDKSVFFSMGLIITTIAVGSLLIIFASKSHSMLVKLICVVVTYLEMNIILWMEVASYYATILLTFLSSGTAVLIIAKRFNSSARVSHEVNYPDTSPRSSKKATIGIFSRSSPEEYNWLISYLIKSTGHTVLPFVITNTNSFKFREEVYRCNYAILYHSMRTGRINITDVTDSLYDNELEYLSSELGIDKVAVVVDDLDDRSSTARNRILKSQPKIANLAWNIFLIDKETKQNNSIMRNLMNPIKEKFMTEGSGHSLGSAIVPFCFLVLWFAAIIFVRSPDDFYNIILIVITNLKVSFMIYRAAFSGSDSLACPLLPLVSAVLLVEGIVMIWGVWSVQMVPYTVIALGMDLLVIMLFNKGPQIFSGHPRKCL